MASLVSAPINVAQQNHPHPENKLAAVPGAIVVAQIIASKRGHLIVNHLRPSYHSKPTTVSGDIQPTSGDQRKSHLLRVGRYAQHFVDALNMEETPVEYLLNR